MPGPSARPPSRLRVAGDIVETPQSTLLDVFDELLNRGVMANGELMLGVAGIDLIYLRLSALFCAADRVLPKPTASLHRSARLDRSARLQPSDDRFPYRLRQGYGGPPKPSAKVESSRSMASRSLASRSTRRRKP